MPDWQKLVHDRFAQQLSGTEIEFEVSDELAGHLEDICETELRRGLSEQDAAMCALGEVKNWRRLAREISDAKGGSTMLKDRIRRLWLPAMVPMIAAIGILLTLASAGSAPRWVSVNPRILLVFYFSWLLIALPLIGALAAYWSRRAGGSITDRAVAALFPAGTMLAIFVVVLIASLVSPGNEPFSRILAGLGRGGLEAVLLPAIASLAGAAPFLRDKRAKADLRVTPA